MWDIDTHIHTTEYCPAIKKKKNSVICNNIDELEGIISSKVRNRKTNSVCFHLYEEPKKYNK